LKLILASCIHSIYRYVSRFCRMRQPLKHLCIFENMLLYPHPYMPHKAADATRSFRKEPQTLHLFLYTSPPFFSQTIKQTTKRVSYSTMGISCPDAWFQKFKKPQLHPMRIQSKPHIIPIKTTRSVYIPAYSLLLQLQQVSAPHPPPQSHTSLSPCPDTAVPHHSP
jgi:hypothetical protein